MPLPKHTSPYRRAASFSTGAPVMEAMDEEEKESDKSDAQAHSSCSSDDMTIKTESLNEEDLVEFFDNDDDRDAKLSSAPDHTAGDTPNRHKSTIISNENSSQLPKRPSLIKPSLFKSKIRRTLTWNTSTEGDDQRKNQFTAAPTTNIPILLN